MYTICTVRNKGFAGEQCIDSSAATVFNLNGSVTRFLAELFTVYVQLYSTCISKYKIMRCHIALSWAEMDLKESFEQIWRISDFSGHICLKLLK